MVDQLTERVGMNEAIGAVAAAVGHLLRVLWHLLGWVPVVAGPSLVLWGTWQIYPPATYILGGLVVSLLTFRRATPRSVPK